MGLGCQRGHYPSNRVVGGKRALEAGEAEGRGELVKAATGELTETR